jgi:ArsR family transcriptional regulator
MLEGMTLTENAPDRLISPSSGCCSLHGGPLEADTAERIAAKLKALSDPTRLRVLSHVAAQGCESVCACDLIDVLDISQPTISHHLKKLVDAGLLTREQRGKWAHYTIVQDAFNELRDFLDIT